MNIMSRKPVRCATHGEKLKASCKDIVYRLRIDSVKIHFLKACSTSQGLFRYTRQLPKAHIKKYPDPISSAMRILELALLKFWLLACLSRQRCRYRAPFACASFIIHFVHPQRVRTPAEQVTGGEPLRVRESTKLLRCEIAATSQVTIIKSFNQNLAISLALKIAPFQVGEYTSAVYFEELDLSIFTQTLHHTQSILGTWCAAGAAGCFERKRFGDRSNKRV